VVSSAGEKSKANSPKDATGLDDRPARDLMPASASRGRLRRAGGRHHGDPGRAFDPPPHAVVAITIDVVRYMRPELLFA
jgi:hypothetical protein